jgi:diguanylate cyclase
MTADAPLPPRPGLLRRLGFGSAPSEEAPAPPQEPSSPDTRRLQRRRELLADIGRFLLTHDLEVDTFTLAVGYDVITGSDARLSRNVAKRVEARRPVTREWLEQTRGDREALRADLQQLMDQLETAARQFSQTTSDARTATSEYNSALEQHADGLAKAPDAMAAQIAGMVRDMLARTRGLESELDLSEQETRKLQQHLAEARRDADIDHLTGLPNRRAFEAVFAREVALAAERKEPICVAFCDIDNFKAINDVHGHEAGDRVLRQVALTLSAISDETCHVARHGGEEFVAVLRGRTLEQARAALEDARIAMAERRLVNRATDKPFGRVTFSAGVAAVHSFAEPSEALRAADTALYEAKKGGRNRVMAAGAVPSANAEGGETRLR